MRYRMPNASVKAKVAAYLLLNEEIKERKAQQNILKAELEPYLEEAETNARGSRVIPFSEPLVVGNNRYASLQKVRKESKVLNEERVFEWIKKKSLTVFTKREQDILSDIVVSVEHIDQDRLWTALVEGLLTEEEFDSLLDVTETWAFSPTKE